MRRKEVKILICVVFRPTAPSPGWPSVNTVMNSVGGWMDGEGQCIPQEGPEWRSRDSEPHGLALVVPPGLWGMDTVPARGGCSGNPFLQSLISSFLSACVGLALGQAHIWPPLSPVSNCKFLAGRSMCQPPSVA